MMARHEVASGGTEEPARGQAVMVRRADHGRPADQAQVVTLLQQHLGSDRAAAEQRYRWLYLDNPHGQAVTFLAHPPGAPAEAVAMTSLFPRRVEVAGRPQRGAIGGDGYVMPAFRRRGIATRLHRAALVGMAEAGVDFMYGPPEPNNLRALLHAGAVVVGWAQWHTRVLSPHALWPDLPGALARPLAWLLRPRRHGLRIERLGPRPDPRVDQVWAASRDDRFAVQPVRDAAYYAWRFTPAPSGLQVPWLLLRGDRPVAAAATEQHGGRAALLDLTCPPDLRGEALAALVHLCHEQGAERVSIQVHTPALPLQAALLRAGFLPRHRKPFQVQVRPGHPDLGLLLRPEGWWYLWGDGDVDQVV